MKFGLKEEIINNIVNQLAKHENIKKALVFGSRARGDYRYNSDIDIAVFADGEVSACVYLDLDEAAGIYKINVVEMGTIQNEKLRENIKDQGIEIYSRG